MALNVNFSVSQSLSNTNLLSFVDTSTGSDPGITERRIYILTANGTYLVTAGTNTQYNLWPIPLATGITLDVLTQMYAPSIRVDWMTGSTATYTKTQVFDFDLAGYLFAYNLTRSVISRPNPPYDSNYYQNKIALIVNLNDSENAITLGSDITNSQAALERAQFLINNESLFF